MSEPYQRPPGFVYRSSKKDSPNSLCCDRIPLEKLASRFGTPLYVYSAATIRERVNAFQRAFREVDHTICYSVKANSNLSILRMLARLGCGFDVVSGGELSRVQIANKRSAGDVVFSGVGKTADEITAAIKAGILIFNVESASELDVLARCANKVRKIARIAIRINPDVPAETHPYISTGLQKHKFGVPLSEARALYAKAAQAKYLEVAGISVHIGSQITDYAPFSSARERVAELVGLLRSDGHDIKFVDAGGGLGINYREGTDDFSACVNAYAQAVSRPLRGLRVKLLLEPGRSIVAPAGVLLTRVIYRKTNGGKKFVIVDAAMNDLIRPALYQAEHQIVPVNDQAATEVQTVDIVGPVCESGDFFARDRSLPAVEEGELLAILDTGAYGMTLASNYNTRPRPAEVLVNGNSAKLIRKRETVREMTRAEMT